MQHYRNSDENGRESAAKETGQNIKGQIEWLGLPRSFEVHEDMSHV
jgi:hypothetical protein